MNKRIFCDAMWHNVVEKICDGDKVEGLQDLVWQPEVRVDENGFAAYTIPFNELPKANIIYDECLEEIIRGSMIKDEPKP